MKELVSPSLVERVFLMIALAGPVLGLVFGAIAGARRSLKAGALSGLVIGLVGPVIFGLWKFYGAITDSLGLDSVRNLVLQIVLFVVLGVLLGIAGFKISTLLKRMSILEDEERNVSKNVL